MNIALKQSNSVSQSNKHHRKHKTWAPYIMLLPAFILFSMFTFYPFFKTIYLTFFLTNAKGQPVKFVLFDNYTRILTSASFENSLLVTFKFAALVGFGTFFISMFLALLCTSKRKGSRIYEVMYALPMAIASAPASIIWFFMLTPGSSVINRIFGLDWLWLSDINLAIYAIAIVTVWSSIGVSFIFLMVGFRNVPIELLESAEIDGASELQRIFRIMIPIASPQIFFVIFLNITSAFRTFAQIRLLTKGGPANSTDVLIYSLYTMAFHDNRFESACVIALVLFLLIFLITRIQFLFEKKVQYQ